jgi:twitching motility protein PilT
MATLGNILVNQGVIDASQLQQAEAYAQNNDSTLARTLVELGLAQETDLVRALAVALHLEYVDLEADRPDESAAALLDPARVRDLNALPVKFSPDGNGLVVAISDPAQRAVADQLQAELGQPVTLAMTTKKMLAAAIDHLASNGESAPAPKSRPLTLADDGGPDLEPAAKVRSEEATSLELDELLLDLLERGGSDLHLTAGVPPTVRVNGDLEPLESFPKMLPDELQKLLYGIMTQKQREQFENELELDLSYSIPGKSRFRVNVFQQRDALGAVMRVIPFEILPLEKLGIPEQVANFAYLPRGFVLVTGPTGSGKSTTLASIIDLINRNRPAHIMTVEDPIEFLHQHKRSVVNQREVGTDTHGFNQALKHVLRQDPDVILVGEMRDLETIQIALTAAETGHLVFGTLHTQDAPQTIDRIIDVFPPHQQEQIRVMLSGALKGVVCQTLLKTADGQGRAAAVEIMIATSAVKNLIREGKTHQIYSSIQAGASHGMVAMDQTLADLVKSGRVTYEAALEKCANPKEFERLAGRG